LILVPFLSSFQSTFARRYFSDQPATRSHSQLTHERDWLHLFLGDMIVLIAYYILLLVLSCYAALEATLSVPTFIDGLPRHASGLLFLHVLSTSQGVFLVGLTFDPYVNRSCS